MDTNLNELQRLFAAQLAKEAKKLREEENLIPENIKNHRKGRISALQGVIATIGDIIESPEILKGGNA